MPKNISGLGIPPQLSKAFSSSMKIGPAISVSARKQKARLTGEVMPYSSSLNKVTFGVPTRERPKGINLKNSIKKRLF